MSCSRACDLYKAVNGKWYTRLGNREYAYEDYDCTTYGPFESEEAAWAEVRDYHSNPGASTTDDRGVIPVPEQVTPPTRRNAFQGARYIYGPGFPRRFG